MWGHRSFNAAQKCRPPNVAQSVTQPHRNRTQNQQQMERKAKNSENLQSLPNVERCSVRSPEQEQIRHQQQRKFQYNNNNTGGEGWEKVSEPNTTTTPSRMLQIKMVTECVAHKSQMPTNNSTQQNKCPPATP